jgi:predicted metal-dependent hydrolase
MDVPGDMKTTTGDDSPATLRSLQVEQLHEAHRALQDGKRDAKRRRDREAANARLSIQHAYASGRVRF